jgi:hypothetical protein
MSAPLEIVGVDVDGVGTPRNDGTRGSALYLVPIRLNRVPTPREAELLIANFDRPSSWTTMHRPGIARVSGDRLLLDGTTVDEVKEYHAKTIRLAVDATNAKEAEFRRRDQAAADAARAHDDKHREHVADVAGEIDFT